MAGFGPNEWLVYEMYQQYLKAPESVDKAWWDFFADYKPTDVGNGKSASPTASAAPATKPTAKAAAPAAEPPAKPAPAPTKPADSPTKTAAKPAPEASDRRSGVRTNGATERGASEGESAAEPQSGPAPHGPTAKPLRGAAARVVTNMEASLAVPTATSV